MTPCSPYSPVKDCVGKATTIFTVFLLRLSFVDMAAKATVHDILSQPLSKRDALRMHACMFSYLDMHVKTYLPANPASKSNRHMQWANSKPSKSIEQAQPAGVPSKNIKHENKQANEEASQTSQRANQRASWPANQQIHQQVNQQANQRMG